MGSVPWSEIISMVIEGTSGPLPRRRGRVTHVNCNSVELEYQALEYQGFQHSRRRIASV